MDSTPRRRLPSIHSLRRFCLRVLLPVLVVGVTASGCVTTGQNPVSGNTRAYGYTWEEEVKLGRQADSQIQQQFGTYDDDALQQYVDEIAQEVLAVSHMRRSDTPAKFRNTEFTFRVLDSPVINAFALPGGYVYVTRGLMAHLNNEAQLAVVLGHEIGHVAARHASQQAARQQFTQGLLVAGAVAGQAAMGGEAANNILGIGGQAAQLMSLSYSRGNERESDRLGVEYATRVGYDAAEGSKFFESLKRIQKQGDQSIPTWQSTHPDPGAREETIVELSRDWEQKVSSTGGRINQDRYYEHLEGIVLGNNPRNGFERDDVFYHPDLEFQFPVPGGWQVQNQPAQVALIQPDQQAFVVFDIAQESTADAVVQKVGGQEGVSVVSRRNTRVGGNPAQRAVLEASTQQGQTVRVLVYAIEYGGNVYRFQGLTAANSYDAYRPTFERTMEGFARLTDPSILNIEPTRLTIRPASRTAPFRSFVDESDLPDDITADDLAIINQVNLDETIEQGRPLKLPR
jgi:predicted Zn-dependent protease